ncbi:MAG: hypothetical protein QHC67_10125 [Sphingobium sp.]|nr:hypothetical protein [Sphingobium sp.]MDX3910162.1 hypothetical protein [Sphingobium sp.]
MQNDISSVSDILDTLDDLARRDGQVRIGDVSAALGQRSYGPFLLVPALLEIRQLAASRDFRPRSQRPSSCSLRKCCWGNGICGCRNLGLAARSTRTASPKRQTSCAVSPDFSIDGFMDGSRH